MAISQAQKIDLLFKQAFGVTKTDLETNKSPSNESIASPLIVRADLIWAESDKILAAATAVPNVVEDNSTGALIECVPDTTTIPINGVYPTWKTNLTDWILPEFHSSYLVKVYVDNPGASNPAVTGTQIFAAGTAGVGEYYFNCSSGVLNFIGGTIPAALMTSKKIYVSGFRYIGKKGLSMPAGAGVGDCIGYEHTQSVESTNWTIVHNRNSRRVQATIYDETSELIIPERIKIINSNEIEVSFLAPIKGTAILVTF